MATGIRHIEFLDASFESGYGVPIHNQLKGSLFIDITEPNLYQNQNGFTAWDVISNGGGSGGTSDSFSVFSANTGTVSAGAANQTMVFSGININVLTDDLNNTITFSAGTGGGGGAAPSANTFVNSFVYNNANKLTINRNDAVSFEVNLNTFTGITINGDLNVTGDTTVNNLTANTVTANQFFGDGSGLSGVSTTDTSVTAFTYNDANKFIIRKDDGSSYEVNVNAFTGITINGDLNVTGNLNVSGDTIVNNLTGDTITANQFFGDGSGLSGVSGSDNYVHSGVYNTGTTSIDFSGTNSATTFSVDVSDLVNLPIVDIDRVTGNITLIGYGVAAACKIQRVNTQGGGYSSTWANGDSVTLDKVWSLRYTYSYF